MEKKTKEIKKIEETKENIQRIRNEKILGALLAIIVLLVVTIFASVYTFFFSGKYLIIKKSSLEVEELEDYVYTNLEEDYTEEEFKYNGTPIVNGEMNSK